MTTRQAVLLLRRGLAFWALVLLSGPLASSFVGEANAQSLPVGLADHYRDCVGLELSENDRPPIFDGDRLLALPAPTLTDLDVGIAAGACLAEATGNLWAYDPSVYLFRTGRRYQQALNAQNRALEVRRQEEMAAQAQERAEAAEQRAAELERIEQERRSAVWAATYDACVYLYRNDTVAALTNQICQPLFLEVGIPGD